MPAVPSNAAAAAAAAEADEAGDGDSGCSPRLGCYGFMAVNILMGLYCSIAYAVSATVAGAVAVAVALLLLALAGRLAQTTGGGPAAASASGRQLLSCPCACGLMTGAGIGVLPAFAYEPDGGGGAHMCAVCLEDVRAGEMVRRLPACGHLFHEDCVDVWLRVRRTCPLCRRVLPPRKSGAAADATASSVAVLPPV